MYKSIKETSEFISKSINNDDIYSAIILGSGMRFVHCHGGSLRSSFHPVLRAVFKGQSARLAQNATFSLVSRSFNGKSNFA